MAKNLKLKIKNTQIAKAVKLSGLKGKLAKRKAGSEEEEKEPEAEKVKVAKKSEVTAQESAEVKAEAEQPRVRARSKSMFAEEGSQEELEEEAGEPEEATVHAEETGGPEPEITPVEEPEVKQESVEEAPRPPKEEPVGEKAEAAVATPETEEKPSKKDVKKVGAAKPAAKAKPEAIPMISKAPPRRRTEGYQPAAARPPRVKLGPTGRHINDILPPKKPKPKTEEAKIAGPAAKAGGAKEKGPSEQGGGESTGARRGKTKAKEYRDVKPLRKGQKGMRAFDSRDRRGLGGGDDERWRKRRHGKGAAALKEDLTVRPGNLKVRLPVSIKDLAGMMKVKSSELIQKLFMQGMMMTINELLDDETVVQLLGHEFQCEIEIDTSEEERIRITDKTIKEEISSVNEEQTKLRAPVVAFMGHVDHGKTSLIDRIRTSDRASEEAGAITQHIGAFCCNTAAGKLTVLDTPGHEAFSAMRARGAEVTDIVVLVVAGDEGIRQQTVEAIQHAKAAGVGIVVALNKCDKPGFDAETVYRQLADNELLPEAWGGETITVNCSAVTGEGVDTLLEMLALQAEVMELRADPSNRARGSVLESEMHKGMGIIATLLVQNGTLRPGDSVVFEKTWGRVRTMRDEHGNDLEEAGPSTPVEITGLASVPSAGEEFIVVSSEKEARDIAEVRMQEFKEKAQLKKRPMSMENLLQQASDEQKKVLNVVLRADVQGSLEAAKSALTNIKSEKVVVDIIFAGVGEISESDVQLAAASKAVIVGFHTGVESHADQLIKELGVRISLHQVIYHAINEVREMMTGLLDKLAEEEDTGSAEVLQVFKSSHTGRIAGCVVKKGTIHRSDSVRIIRGGEEIWRGPITSIRRVKDDVKEISKGFECGFVLRGFDDFQEGDELQAFTIKYITQEL